MIGKALTLSPVSIGHMDKNSRFKAKLLRPSNATEEPCWTFILLPAEASQRLPRRGRTSVEGTLNGHPFQATLEPDGQLSHWLRVTEELMRAAGVTIGDTVTLDIMPVAQEPEPEIPLEFREALAATPEALRVWNETTTLARVDWIHWITSAKQSKTRTKRQADACRMLASGKKRVCCFDPSGHYSKAFCAPDAAEE
ncbi:MAG: YdeI/OmpD-associated family protein [Candidatus Thiodiazotropha sp.]